MNLLFVLSAILSALTGVVGGARPLEVAARHQAIATQVERIAVVAAPGNAGHAHLLGGFGAIAAFALRRTASVVPTTAPRLYLDRPRA